MSRLTLTQQTVRCPLHDDTASLQVRTRTDAAPSRRHRDVTACSLLAPGRVDAFEWRHGFADIAPPVSYLLRAAGGPARQSVEVCPKPCLDVLNAAESGGAAGLRCASEVGDGLDLIRQTQSPAVTRVMWMHGV
jgi:hypothetical protein